MSVRTKHKLLFLLSSIVTGLFCGSSFAIDNVEVKNVFFVTSPKWYFLKDKALTKDDALLFRKYAFPVIDGKIRTGEIENVKNLLSFVCHPKAMDYVVFHFPNWLIIPGIDKDSWSPKLQIRISGKDFSFNAEAEHGKGELFIDFTEEWGDLLKSTISSEEIQLAIGEQASIVTIKQLHSIPTGGNVDNFLSGTVPLISSAIGGGKVKSFNYEEVQRECAKFKKKAKIPKY